MNKARLIRKFDRVRSQILETNFIGKEEIVNNLNEVEQEVLRANTKQRYLIKDFILLFRREKRFLEKFVKQL